MNPIAAMFNKIIGKSFTVIKGNPVLMLVNGMLKTEELNDKTWINAISCQTIDEFDVHKLKCSHSFKDFEYQNKLIACPLDCTKKTQ